MVDLVELVNMASKTAGYGPNWNKKFLRALDTLGLELTSVSAHPDSIMAPKPVPDKDAYPYPCWIKRKRRDDCRC